MKPNPQQSDDSGSVGSNTDDPITPATTPQTAQSSLISQVLEATLTGGNSSLSEAEWAALSEVARAHPPATPLQLALVCELVSAFLKTRFDSLAQDKAMFHKMTLRIAGSLWTYPRSQQHLIRFWELLSSEVRK